MNEMSFLDGLSGRAKRALLLTFEITGLTSFDPKIILTVPKSELMKYKNVGKATVKEIYRKLAAWDNINIGFINKLNWYPPTIRTGTKKERRGT